MPTYTAWLAFESGRCGDGGQADQGCHEDGLNLATRVHTSAADRGIIRALYCNCPGATLTKTRGEVQLVLPQRIEGTRLPNHNIWQRRFNYNMTGESSIVLCDLLVAERWTSIIWYTLIFDFV